MKAFWAAFGSSALTRCHNQCNCLIEKTWSSCVAHAHQVDYVRQVSRQPWLSLQIRGHKWQHCTSVSSGVSRFRLVDLEDNLPIQSAGYFTYPPLARTPIWVEIWVWWRNQTRIWSHFLLIHVFQDSACLPIQSNVYVLVANNNGKAVFVTWVG